MARKNTVTERIKNLTSMKISKLSKNELVELVAQGSKLVNQNLRRIGSFKVKKDKKPKNENIKILSEFIRSSKHASDIKIVERKRSSASKLTIEQLKNELRNISIVLSRKSSSVRETKKIYKNLGMSDLTKITKDQWSNIRIIMEHGGGPYHSNDAIVEYYKAIEKGEEDKFNDIIEDIKAKQKEKEEEKIEEMDVEEFEANQLF